MRQAGVIAAAGIVALETMVERLADDHARARRLADALAERWPGSVDPATVRTNIVCADARPRCPDDFVARLARPRRARAARSTRARSASSRTRTSTTTTSTRDDRARSTSSARGLTCSTPTIPARVLAVYAHPDDPEISAGGTLARWADAGAEVHVLVTTRGDKGTNDPDADPDALARAPRSRRPRPRHACSGSRRAHHLDHPDGELADDRALRLELVRAGAHGPPRRRAAAPIRPRCSSATATSTTATTASPAGRRSTRSSPAAGNPHYFPELRAEGLDVHQVRAVYLSGTFEPNVWIDIAATLERKIEALFCHASQLVETGDWFREFLRESRRGRGPRRGRHVRGGVPPDRSCLIAPGGRSGPGAGRRPAGSGGWARHSDCARSISTGDDAGADRRDRGARRARRRAASRSHDGVWAW